MKHGFYLPRDGRRSGGHRTTVRALSYYHEKRQALFPWGETLFVGATDESWTGFHGASLVAYVNLVREVM
jgi:hypothetical protein